MVEVKRAYRNSQGSLTEGSKVATLKYDALNRRIVKDIDGSGDWDCAYHYYYTGPRMVELRNGSGNVLKQYVWGRQYVDELVQIAVNDDPADAGEDDCETFYWVMQDAHFNVLGLADSSGNLKERYEYTPYGQRTIYKSAGTNDPMCMSPILESQRVTVSSVDQPYGLCDTGHQGLLHDKEFTLVYNRARYLHPTLGRFISRDPLMYIDGMSLYEYVGSRPIVAVDPLGLLFDDPDFWDSFIGRRLAEEAEYYEDAINSAPEAIIENVANAAGKVAETATIGADAVIELAELAEAVTSITIYWTDLQLAYGLEWILDLCAEAPPYTGCPPVDTVTLIGGCIDLIIGDALDSYQAIGEKILNEWLDYWEYLSDESEDESETEKPCSN